MFTRLNAGKMPEEAHGYWLPGHCYAIALFRHSREGGNPYCAEICVAKWIPAFAGMTNFLSRAQLEPLNLTRRSFWQLTDELNPARIFEWREFALYVLL